MAKNSDVLKAREEFLAEATSSFPSFCSILDILPKERAKGLTKFKFNNIQKIFNIERTGWDIVLKPRQIGFSTLELARDVYHFVTRKGANVVILCQSDQNNLPLTGLSAIVERYLRSLKNAGMNLQLTNEAKGYWAIADRDATLTIRPAGASEAAADKAGRGLNPDRLHATETAFWEFPELTLNAIESSITPFEAGGEFVIESTPNGAGGLFYDRCTKSESGGTSFKFHFYPWYRHEEYKVKLKPTDRIVVDDKGRQRLAPTDDYDQNRREDVLVSLGVGPEQLRWYRDRVGEKGPDLTDQEFPRDADTCFLISGNSFFNKQITKRLQDEAVSTERKFELFEDRRGVRIWKQPVKGRRYVLAVDPSEGGEGDKCAGIVFDLDSGEHVATIDVSIPPYELAHLSALVGKHFNTAVIAVERNNHGHACLQALAREQKYPRIYISDDKKPGWLTNNSTRPAMLDTLQEAYQSGAFKTIDRPLLKQISTMVIGPPPLCRAEARSGEHDDLVMAAAIGWMIRRRRQPMDFHVGGSGSRGWSGGGGWGVGPRPGW